MTVSAAVFPKRKQNLMQTLCSFKSAIEKSTKIMTEAQKELTILNSIEIILHIPSLRGVQLNIVTIYVHFSTQNMLS